MAQKIGNSDTALFPVEIEQNAFDSFVHAVEHFRHYMEDQQSRDLKYVVLHAFHAAELFLKVRLAQEHPLLIYQKPQKNDSNSHTADLQTVIARLRAAGVNITDSHKALKKLQKTRNQLEHYSVQLPIERLENYLGRTFYFLDVFLRDELSYHLDDELEQRLDDDSYRQLTEYLFTYHERLELVERELKKYILVKGTRSDTYDRLICESCGEPTILWPNPATNNRNDPVHCKFCDARFSIQICEGCGDAILEVPSSPPIEDFGLPLCELCQVNLLQRFD